MSRQCRKCLDEKPIELFKKSEGRYRHTCKACDAERVRAYQKANPGTVQAKNKRWVEANAARVKPMAAENAKRYAERHPDRVKANKHRYRASDAGKATESAYNFAYKSAHRAEVNAKKLLWMKENKGRVNSATGRRRAAKIRATPGWANNFFMAEAYELALLRRSVTGIEWEVDHIVPLISPVVCGLHCEMNLQVIPAVANRSKGNRTWPNGPMGA